MPMRCVFIYGPVASGKLTVASALQARSGMPLFHNHLAVDAALSLFEFGSPAFVRLRELIWLSAFAEAARAGQSFIFTFHPERSVPASFVAQAASVIKREGGRLVFVALTCNESTIESRIQSPTRAQFRKVTSVELYRTLRDSGAFRFTSLPNPELTIATDAVAPESAAEQIFEHLKSSA